MSMAGTKNTFFEIVKLLLHRQRKIKEEEQKSDGNMKFQRDSTEKYFLQKTHSLPHNKNSVCDINLQTHSVKKESHQFSKRKYQSVKVRPSSNQDIHDKNENDNNSRSVRKLSLKRVTSLKKYKASKLNQSLPNINEQVFDLPDTGEEARTISSSVYTVDSIDVNTKNLFRHNNITLDDVDNAEVYISFE